MQAMTASTRSRNGTMCPPGRDPMELPDFRQSNRCATRMNRERR